MSQRSLKIVVLLCLASLGLCARLGPPASGRARGDRGEGPTEGEKIFREKCGACHTTQSAAPLDPEELARSQGPTLAYAGNKFQGQWLEKWLVSPYRIRPAGYLPYRHMMSTAGGDVVDEAALPTHLSLSPAEATAVVGYLGAAKRNPNPYPAAGPSQEIRAQVHFEKILGCGSCHQARPGQGGLSGPELYTAPERLNREWAVAFIAEPPYWGTVPMPKISVRAEQLAAVGDYLFQHPAEKPAATVSAGEPRLVGKSRPAPATRAELLYQMFCSQCHGIQGDGKGINAPHIFISPRNHTSQEEMGMLTDDRLYAAIRYGGTAVGKSVLMPPWGGVMKDADIKALVEYVRALSNTGAGREQ